MNEYDDYMLTYSELVGDNFKGSNSEWLEYLSPKLVEAYDEYKNTGDQEDY